MDEKNKDIDEREETAKCAWCGETLPKSEMLKEADLSHICRRCADALRSRGEKLTIEDEYPRGFAARRGDSPWGGVFPFCLGWTSRKTHL